MGLDMYLLKEVYCDSISNDSEVTVIRTKHRTGETSVYKTYTAHSLIDNIGYWRKAYGIHDWICSRLNNQVENNQRIPIEEKLLRDLLADCESARKNPSILHEKFPMHKPFYSLDHYQQRMAIEDLDTTIEILSQELGKPDAQEFFGTYLYQACW